MFRILYETGDIRNEPIYIRGVFSVLADIKITEENNKIRNI